MATPTFIIYDGAAVNNLDREVISHSAQFHDWGLRFRDRGPNGQGSGPDAMIFQAAGNPVFSVVLGNGNVGIGLPANQDPDPSIRLEVVSNTGGAIRGTSSFGFSAAVAGEALGPNGIAVFGEANNQPTSIGVYGRSNTGTAGFFANNVRVVGILTKGGGGFRIDHPLDPENKYLCHSFVESPDMMNVYNGNVTTDASGDAAVTLPDYFEALNQDFRYQLTVIGQFAQAIVAGEISNKKFIIKTDKPDIKVSWQVTGIRKDPFANTHRLMAEDDKPADERGAYLHPEAYGKSETQSVDYVIRKRLQVP